MLEIAEPNEVRVEMSKVKQSTEGGTALLASIVDCSNDAIIAKTPEGIITSWNRGAEQIHGYSASEIIGHPVTILVPPDRPDDVRGILARVGDGELLAGEPAAAATGILRRNSR